MKTKILYRPVGPQELALIVDSNFRAFPPRLSWQPIFYPVLNFEYARQISERWNASSAENLYCGFVTKFAIVSDYISQFEVQTVGGPMHQELWVPAEELAVFNSRIDGAIQVVAGYYGLKFDKQRLPVEVQKLLDQQLLR
ncbi:MAG: hypothetical protein WA958_03585 [Tunicatimonas sp.]